MLRDRLLRPRWLVSVIVAWGVALAAVPHPAAAAPLPPARADGAPGDPDVAALATELVREQLVRLGVSPPDAAALLARLSPAERAELAARADELAAGGNSTVAFVAFGIIVAMLIILILELMGRRVISRPS